MIEFNGELTQEFRKAFIQRRRELGLTQSQAAERLKVSWLTIRNWEKGYSERCRQGIVSRIRLFFEQEGEKKEGPCPKMRTRPEERALYCRLLSCYDSLIDFPQLQHFILMQLKVTIRQAISMMERKLVREMGIEPTLR